MSLPLSFLLPPILGIINHRDTSLGRRTLFRVDGTLQVNVFRN